MWREIKVLLIDDNAQRRHDLKVILDFLGEEVVASGVSDWRQTVTQQVEDSADICAVIIGDTGNKPAADVISDVHDWDKAMPILYSGDSLPEDQRQGFLATLTMPPSYNQLLDSLHRCQIYREQHNQSRSRGERREIQLFRGC